MFFACKNLVNFMWKKDLNGRKIISLASSPKLSENSIFLFFQKKKNIDAIDIDIHREKM